MPIRRTRCAAAAAALLLASALTGPAAATVGERSESETVSSLRIPRHPLDPLTEVEIRTATAIFKAAGVATDQTYFVQLDRFLTRRGTGFCGRSPT